MNLIGIEPLVSLSFAQTAKPQSTNGLRVTRIIAKLRHKRRSTSGQLVQHHASRWTNTSVVEKPALLKTSANSHYHLGTQKRSKARKKKPLPPLAETQTTPLLLKVKAYLIGLAMGIVGTARRSPGRLPTTTELFTGDPFAVRSSTQSIEYKIPKAHGLSTGEQKKRTASGASFSCPQWNWPPLILWRRHSPLMKSF